MTPTERAELRKLADELTRAALHGKPPLETTMALATGVLTLLDATEWERDERSCFTCAWNRPPGVCYHPTSDLDVAIDEYAIESGCAANNGGMPTDRTIRCPGWAAKEPK